jgi:UTP--glucose-1-phosphate uridylyltransferase
VTNFPGTQDVYRISDLVGKPNAEESSSRLAIIGRYILTSDIFSCLENTQPNSGGEIQLTALRALATKRPLYGNCFDGKRFDAGDKLGFLEATVEIALSREDLGTSFRQYLKRLQL